MVDDAKLMSEAEKLCAHFATQPTYGLAQIKRAFDAAEDNDLSTQLDLERKLQREAGSHPDYAEGVKAFLGEEQAGVYGEAVVSCGVHWNQSAYCAFSRLRRFMHTAK